MATLRSTVPPPTRARAIRPVALAGLLTGLLIQPALAQRAGDGFLFREPVASLALRVGIDRPLAGGDLFRFVTDELTLSGGDFSSVALGAELAFRLSPRGDLVLGVGYAGTTARSEFRDWVDQDNRPIEQTTRLRRVPLTASARWYLADRGRSVGRFAWVPARAAPYVGVGFGGMWYEFLQDGDFVDEQTLNVFHDRFRTSAWAKTAHAMLGLDVALGARFVTTMEGRYTLTKARPDGDYRGFDRLDLSGFSVTAGLGIRLPGRLP
jgi:hypothetical protein